MERDKNGEREEIEHEAWTTMGNWVELGEELRGQKSCRPRILDELNKRNACKKVVYFDAATTASSRRK